LFGEEKGWGVQSYKSYQETVSSWLFLPRAI
jgi:hypothetical protein